MCESGRVYKECSRSSERVCGSPAEDDVSSGDCLQGCFCPDGTADHEGTCIPIEECPCNFQGEMHAPGKEMKNDCNTCKCESGEWKCSEKNCAEAKQKTNPEANQETNPKPNPKADVEPARCEVYGDPHYKTFDGKRFDFMGKCSYYLMRNDLGTDIIAENGDCPCKQNILVLNFLHLLRFE